MNNYKKGDDLKPIKKILPQLAFCFGLVFFSVLYGMSAQQGKLFPYYQLRSAALSAIAVMQHFTAAFTWYLHKTDQAKQVAYLNEDAMEPGLTKIVNVGKNATLSVKVIDGKGKVYQDWHIDWFKVWPKKPAYLTDYEAPKSRPGTHVHGAVILPDGDLIFNFEHLAMVRMDACGNVKWRLPFRTHHSIFRDDDGNLWAPGQIDRDKPRTDMPFYGANYVEPYIVKVSPQGKILLKKSLIDLLKANDQEGALYATTTRNFEPLMLGDAYVPADTLHLNNVEIFSKNMKPGFFTPGDILISLRNINSIMVFSPDWKLKFKSTFNFVRQHDPDFVDGNHIAVFDNNNTVKEDNPAGQSRIVMITAPSGEQHVVFSGTKARPFYTDIMGTEQWLPNGNLLLAETRKGRVLELDHAGNTVWDYYNIIKPGLVGIVEGAQRLPVSYNADFFANARKQCTHTNNNKTQ